MNTYNNFFHVPKYLKRGMIRVQQKEKALLWVTPPGRARLRTPWRQIRKRHRGVRGASTHSAPRAIKILQSDLHLFRNSKTKFFMNFDKRGNLVIDLVD